MFSQLTYLMLVVALTSLNVIAQSSQTVTEVYDSLVKDPKIWTMTKDQVATYQPSYDWKNTKQPNNFVCRMNDMVLWEQPVHSIVLRLNKATHRARAISIKVITENQAEKMTDDEILAKIVSWRKLVNSKLQSAPISLPNRFDYKRNITSIAWPSKNYIVIMMVHAREKILKVDLTFHETNEGQRQLKNARRSGKNAK